MLHRLIAKPPLIILRTGGGIQRVSGNPRRGHAPAPLKVQRRDEMVAQRRIDIPFGAMSVARTRAAAGIGPVPVSADTMTGSWILRFGMFGAPDHETRGGVIAIRPGRIVGGDSNFVYAGEWALAGTELTASIEIVRHGTDPYLCTLFGTDEDSYQIDCIAEAITPDLFEGRIRRCGFPDARIVLARFQPGLDKANRVA